MIFWCAACPQIDYSTCAQPDLCILHSHPGDTESTAGMHALHPHNWSVVDFVHTQWVNLPAKCFLQLVCMLATWPACRHACWSQHNRPAAYIGYSAHNPTSPRHMQQVLCSTDACVSAWEILVENAGTLTALWRETHPNSLCHLLPRIMCCLINCSLLLSIFQWLPILLSLKPN